jgi:hypothetical protein
MLTGHSLLFLGEGRPSHQARRHPCRRWRVLDGRKLCVAWKPFYQPFAGLEGDPSNLGGVFDTDNPENPLADYT